MKKITLLCFSLQIIVAQYQYKSQYLQNPEMNFGYVDSCAKLWMKAYDTTNGGFFVNVGREGNPFGASIKNTLSQSRDAYGFIRAFQMTGDTTYLRYARYALDFMYKNSWDKTYGGWYNSIGNTGTPSNVNETKTAFYQHYALLGVVAAYEATRDTTDWSWLMKGYEYNENKLWDTTAAIFGYYDYVAANGTNPTDKSFNATVDAVTTHVLHLYLMTGEQKYKTRLLQLADNMINWLAASAAAQAIGFAEKYTTTWQIKSSTSNDEQRTIMGHVLKTGWCLARIYELEKDPLYLSTAEQLVQSVLDKGYDHQYGGPYKDYNRITGAMMMYGQDTAKAWWQMEQAITAGLMLYQLTGKEKYIKMADETDDFFMKYFVDHQYGDVYENRFKNGGFISDWGTTKGSGGKAAYHSIETGYYAYLYGTLLARKEPATLYYSFNTINVDRQLKMRPVGVPDNYLKISSVKKDGAAYSNFDSTNLVLTLPAGTGGIFAVTYQPTSAATYIASSRTAPEQFALEQNYPNPFNPTTTIGFKIHVSGFTSLKIYDMLGREIATVVNDNLEAGRSYSVNFDGSLLSSGIYFARLESGGKHMIKKMLLVK